MERQWISRHLEKGFLEWLKSTKPDILCLQETKAWAEQLSGEQLNPDGYFTYFSKPERKGYSGVATLSRTMPEKADFGFGDPLFDREGRVLLTEHQGITLANIYFPNGKMNRERLAYKMQFYEKTIEYFSNLRKQGKRIIVCGDYNTAHKPIDLAHPKQNEKVLVSSPKSVSGLIGGLPPDLLTYLESSIEDRSNTPGGI